MTNNKSTEKSKTINNTYKLDHNSMLNFPFHGTLVRGNKNGFSFISNPPNDHFVHISNNVGERVQNMESLDHKDCVFAIGASPFAFKNKKPKWENVVIQWMSLDGKQTSDGKEISREYIEKSRKDSFARINLEQFKVFLLADWYVALWKKRASTTPKSHLKRDSIIEDALINKIGKCASIEDIDALFECVAKSYWFPEDKKEILSKFFDPDNWQDKIFPSIDFIILYSTLSCIILWKGNNKRYTLWVWQYR